MKKITALILSLAILCSFCIIPVSADEHWASGAAQALMEKGIVSGYSDGSLKLDNWVTRAEFIKIINKTMGYTEKADASFSDVSADKWYYEEMLIAKKAGYITGDNEGNANPEANITRAEASVILARILKLDTLETDASISDISEIPDWAKGPIVALFNKGIIKGYEDGSFKYNNTLTRGEGFSLVVKISSEAPEAPKTPEIEDNPFVPDSSSSASGSNVSVSVSPSTGGGSGGSSGGGGGGGGGAVLPRIATIPNLKYNQDISEYTLAWSPSTGAKDYNIKISLEGEEDYIIKNYSETAIELYSHFAKISENRTNAEETFTVSVMANGKVGYQNSTYSKTITLTASFESIEAPVLTEKNGMAGGIHRVIVTWDAVENSAGYDVSVIKGDDTLLVSGTDYTYDAVNRKLVIPDTSVCDNETVVKVLALSPDKQAFKDSSEATLIVPVATGGGGDVLQDGSKNNPWIITSGEQIEAISDPSNPYGYQMDDYYVITKNITVTKPIYSKVYYSSGQKADVTFKGNITGKLNGTDFKPTVTLAIGSEATPYVSDSIAVGFVNYLDENCEISNLMFDGIVNVVFADGLANITDRSGVSSVVGYAAKNSKITNCINKATITGPYLTGGIVGYSSTTKIDGCTNYGDVTGTTYVGGISSQGGVTLTNSHNYGKVTGTTYVGGLCGSTNNSTITGCSNHGDVKATTDQAGGLVAWSSGNYKLEFSKCFNAGDIYIKKGKAAGVFGGTYRTQQSSYKSYRFTFTDCYNSGKIYDLDGNEAEKPAFVHALGRANYNIAFGLTNVYSTSSIANFVQNLTAESELVISNVFVVGDLAGNGNVDNQVGIEESDLINLIADNPTVFKSDIWDIADNSEYKYPQLVDNLHIKEVESVPGLKTFTAKTQENNGLYDIVYSWTLPENLEKLSIKIVNNTEIEDVTDGYIELDFEGENKTGYTFLGALADCYYEIFIKLEYSDGTESTEENYEYLIPII